MRVGESACRKKEVVGEGCRVVRREEAREREKEREETWVSDGSCFCSFNGVHVLDHTLFVHQGSRKKEETF